MKAITLYQPWATLVAIGAKKIETRSWPTSYRGPLAIHAGMNKDFVSFKSSKYICDKEPFYSVLQETGQIWRYGSLPLGAVIAVCEIVGVEKITDADVIGKKYLSVKAQEYWTLTEQEYGFGEYTPGRFMWFLKDIRIGKEPIPAKGAMQLWEWGQPV